MNIFTKKILLITCTFFLDSMCNEKSRVYGCPDKCLCNLPRNVVCQKKGLQNFPYNINETVDTINLSDNLLTTLPELEINKLRLLETLDLRGNRLNSLPQNVSQLVNLKNLILSKNRIYNVQNITSIDQLRNLTVLVLSGNRFRSLDNLRSKTLVTLYANDCEIEELTFHSLVKLPNLVTLSLRNNPIKSIVRPIARKLQYLDLSSCQLKVLDPDTFGSMPVLTDLNLSDNAELVHSTWDFSLSHEVLKTLNLFNCKLDRPGLHKMPTLETARLSRNHIEMLPDLIFAENHALVFLFLDNNHLQHIGENSFYGLSNLTVLDLSANRLDYIPPGVFSYCTKLKYLNLNHNYLRKFPYMITQTVNLDLSANFIEYIDSYSLVDMPNLTNLSLCNNYLKKIPDGLQSEKLEILVLSSNDLSFFNNATFVNLPKLEKLILTGNKFRDIFDPRIFYRNANLSLIRVNDNPWHCNCTRLSAYYHFMSNMSTLGILSSGKCQSPANVSDFIWEAACFEELKSISGRKNKTWGLVLVSVLTFAVLIGTIVSVRHSVKLKRQARNQRQEIERAEIRERLRLLQRRNQMLREEQESRLDNSSSEPRVHLREPPSYEEAVQMPRLARSLDVGLNANDRNSVQMRFTFSSESLRPKKRKPRRRNHHQNRSQSEDDVNPRRSYRALRQTVIRSNRNRENYSGQNDSTKNQTNSCRGVGVRRQNSRSSANSGVPMSRPSSSATPKDFTRRRIRRKRAVEAEETSVSSDDEASEPEQQSSSGRTRQFSIDDRIRISHDLPREPRRRDFSTRRISTEGES